MTACPQTVSDDRDSILKLVQVTRASIADPAISQALCAVQIQDTDAKIEQAIEQTLQLLRVAVSNAAMGSELGLVGMISTPTISRILCSRIVYGSYGLPHAYSLEAEKLLGQIVWSHLAQYMRYAWANFLVFPVGGMLMLEAPAAARMVLKCACDLIIIMDCAFRRGPLPITMETLKETSKQYARSKMLLLPPTLDDNKQRQPRRELVHAAVNDIFPIASGHGRHSLVANIHTERRISTIRDGCRDIISRYRFEDSDTLTLVDSEELLVQQQVQQVTAAVDKDDIEGYELELEPEPPLYKGTS